MSNFVLDASALIAMLKGEPGGSMVAAAMDDAQMSVVNYAEVVGYFIQSGMPTSAVDDMLDPLPVLLIPSDTGLARSAGHLRKTTASAGLSLGDRFCLALARREGLPAWTADRQWTRIAKATGVDVVPIR